MEGDEGGESTVQAKLGAPLFSPLYKALHETSFEIPPTSTGGNVAQMVSANAL